MERMVQLDEEAALVDNCATLFRGFNQFLGGDSTAASNALFPQLFPESVLPSHNSTVALWAKISKHGRSNHVLSLGSMPPESLLPDFNRQTYIYGPLTRMI
jgi:hypothetical protein